MRWLRRIATWLLAFAAVLFALIWNDRRTLEYNEEGRYFDSEQGTVLLEQAVAVYGGLAAVCAFLAVASWIAWRRK